MKYQGSKASYINDIVPILQFEKQLLGTEYYYEPFVGGANIIQNIDFKYKFGSDLRQDLIDFYNYIKEHGIDWIPNSCPDRDTYFDIIYNQKDKIPEQLYFCYKQFGSFNGMGNLGYGGRTDKFKSDNMTRNKNRLRQEYNKIIQCDFRCADYRDIDYKPGSIIYMDPPYISTRIEAYKINSFDHKSYYEFVRQLANKCFVLCSEYYMPREFINIKWMVAKNTIRHQVDAIEGLFVVKGGLGVDELLEWLRRDDYDDEL